MPKRQVIKKCSETVLSIQHYIKVVTKTFLDVEFAIHLFQTAQILPYLTHNFLHRLGNVLAQICQDASSMLDSDGMRVDQSVLLCPIMDIENLEEKFDGMVNIDDSISLARFAFLLPLEW